MVLYCPACGPLHTVNNIIIHSGHNTNSPDIACLLELLFELPLL